MRKFYGILLVLLAFCLQSYGTHILGGELTYRYIGNDGPADRPFRYLIRFVGYVDRVGVPGGTVSNWGCGNLEINPFLAIYGDLNGSGQFTRIPRVPGTPDQNPYTQQRLALLNWRLPSHGPNIQGNCPINPYYGGVRPLVIQVPQACVVPGLSELSIAITDTTFEVQLPLSVSGYKVQYQNCCRTEATTNIFFPGGNNDPGNTWEATIPSPIFVNSSPQFIGDAVPFFCRGDTAIISNNAFDPDGDRLIYSFATPYSGNGTNPPINHNEPENSTYRSGYSQSQPFGPGGYAYINPSTGLTKYYCNVNGNYAVAVDIQEYRTLSNGTEILLSTTRREFLVVVKDCAPNPPPSPVLGGTSVGTTFIRSEGDSVVFDIKSFDVDTTTISAESELFDSSTNPGSLAICPTVTGVDTVRTTFRWKINCGVTGGIVRNYSVVVKYTDKGCPPKTNNVVYTIVVNPFKAPTITGKDSICSTDASTTYSVTAGTGREWKMLGGSVIGSATGSSVNVTFPGDTARIRLVVTSGLGCKDSTSRKITKVQFVPILATASSAFVCQDSSIQLEATGGYSQVSWSPVSGLNSTTIRNPLATPTDTAQFVVSSSGPGGCLAKDTISLIWVPRIANAGSDSILCSGLKRYVGGNIPGSSMWYSFQWSPSTGVESDTSFRTQVTLQNPGIVNQISTFVQQATHKASGCASTDTVNLTVKPLPVVNAGPDTATLCSGGKTLLGTPESGNAIFKWFPETGLTNPAKDTTTISLNPDSMKVQLVRYYLTKTETSSGPPVPGEPSCQNTDSIVVKINPLPFFELAEKDSLCSGLSTTIGTTSQPGFSYAWSPARGLASSTSATTTIGLSNPNQLPGDTVYSLLVTNTLTNCFRAKEITIRVNPLPLVFAGNDTTLCSGDTLRIGERDQAGFSYRWNPSEGLSPDSLGLTRITLLNPLVGGAAVFKTYRLVKINNQTLCRNTDSLVVKVKALPVVDAGPDTVTICSGLKTILGTVETNPALFQWSPSDGILNPNRDTTSVSLNPDSVQVQFYTYHLKKTESVVLPGEPACSNTDSIKLRVNPLPFFNLAEKDSLCSGLSTTIGTSGQTGFSYGWSPDRGLTNPISPTTQISLSNPSQTPGDTVYTLRVTNLSTQCLRDKQIRIRVNPLPVVNSGLDTAFCSGDSISIGEANQSGFSYAWSPANGLNSGSASSPRISLINPNTGGANQSFSYQLTKINNTTTCRNADSLVVQVKPLPIANAADGDSVFVCSQSSVSLGEAGLPSHLYSWSPDTALTSISVPDPVLTIRNPGQQPVIISYKVRVVNTISRCRNSDSVWVKVNPLPIVPLAYSDTAVCSKDTIRIGGDSTPGFSYAWSPRSQLGDTTLALTPFSVVNNTDAPMVYPFSLQVTINATQCRNSRSVNVRVNPLPDADAGADKEVCSRDSVQIGIPPVPGRKYNWSPVEGLSNPNISNPKLSLVNNGSANAQVTYTLTVTDISSSTLCDSNDVVVVTIKPLPEAMAASQDSVQVCATLDLGLGTLPQAGYEYTWTPAAFLSQSTISNPVFNSNAGTGAESLLYVVNVLNTANACRKQDSVYIKVNGLPQVNVGSLDSLCSGDTIQIGPGVVPLPNTYQWTPTTGFLDSNPINPRLTLINPGSNVIVNPYRFIVTNIATGCKDSATLNVRVNPLPPANAGTDRSICSGETLEIGSASQFGFDYQWNSNSGLDLLNLSNPQFTMTQVGDPRKDTLVVLMTNSTTQCRKRDSVTVTTNPRPAPMTFAPFSGTVCPFTPNVNYSVTNSVAGNTYAWVVSGGTQVSGANTSAITVNWNGTNPSARIIVTPTNEYGCIGNRDSLQLVINQNLKPTKPFGDSVLCSFSRTGKIYSTIPTPGSNYTWKLVGATEDSTLSNNGFTSVDWALEEGIAKIWIQQQSATIDPGTNTPVQCYGQSDTLLVKINRSPDSTLTIVGPVSVCGKPAGTPEGYTLSGFTGSGYQWSVSPSADFAGGQGSDSLVVNWTSTGNYTLEVLETSAQGCVGIPRRISVEVNPLPSPGISTLTNLSICPNDLQKGYFALSQPDFENSTYRWFVVGGTPSTPLDQGFLGVNWDPTGPYSLTLREISTRGCAKDTLLPLQVDLSSVELRNVTLLKDDENQVELQFSLLNPERNPSTLEVWRRELGSGSSGWQQVQAGIQKNISRYIDQPGFTSEKAYQYKVVSTNLCARPIESDAHNTLLLKVLANQPEETSELNWNPYIGWPQGVAGYSVLRKVDNESTLSVYESGILAPGANLVKTYKNGSDGFQQCYQIQADQREGGFSAISNTACVKFDNPLVFYNLFTPNGDGKNDEWFIRNLHLYPENELLVYDRWGQKILDRKNYGESNLWSGNGLVEGVYFYKFLVPGRSLEFRGWVTIKRD